MLEGHGLCTCITIAGDFLYMFVAVRWVGPPLVVSRRQPRNEMRWTRIMVLEVCVDEYRGLYACRAVIRQVGYVSVDRRWVVSIWNLTPDSPLPRASDTYSSSLIFAVLLCHAAGLWTPSSTCRVREGRLLAPSCECLRSCRP